MKSAAYAFTILAFLATLACHAEVNQVEKVAEDVYFHEGEIRPSGHCNNGWIIFEVTTADLNTTCSANTQRNVFSIKRCDYAMSSLMILPPLTMSMGRTPSRTRRF